MYQFSVITYLLPCTAMKKAQTFLSFLQSNHDQFTRDLKIRLLDYHISVMIGYSCVTFNIVHRIS